MCGLFGVVTVGDNFISRNDITQLIRLGHKRIEQFRANQLRAPNVRARL